MKSRQKFSIWLNLPTGAAYGEILSEEQKELLKHLAPLQIEASYPERKERVAASLTKAFAKNCCRKRRRSYAG